MEHFLPAVFARREHLAHLGHINHLRRTSAIRTLLPGVYCWSGIEDSFELRAEAVRLWDPKAIFLGATAARLSWWPSHPEGRLLVSGTHARTPRPWLEVTSKRVPGELMAQLDTISVADPALAVLEMVAAGDGNAICEALRRGATTLARMQNAVKIVKWANGNTMRRRLLHESRDEPWSPLEREAHTLLRAAHIRGWRTNYPVRTVRGKLYIDVALVEERVAVELDGWEHHGTREAFHADRHRWNSFTLAGWEVLHFTYRTLPTMVPTLQQILRTRR
ncbi:MAG: DUF559 domain-containing protein [Propionibacteriaceae bacterium]|nr:DUF559 domain-containing protein [Propionibacteriaceae bacterium]